MCFYCMTHHTKRYFIFYLKCKNYKFTKENAGSTLQCLEFEVSNIYENGFMQHIYMHWKGACPILVDRPEMSVDRWVNVKSQNAKYICTVYLPSALRKCKTYARSQEDYVYNVQGLLTQLLKADYPRSWFKSVWYARHPRQGVG